MKIVMYEMWRTRECDLQKQHAVEQQVAGAGWRGSDRWREVSSRAREAVACAGKES